MLEKLSVYILSSVEVLFFYLKNFFYLKKLSTKSWTNIYKSFILYICIHRLEIIYYAVNRKKSKIWFKLFNGLSRLLKKRIFMPFFKKNTIKIRYPRRKSHNGRSRLWDLNIEKTFFLSKLLAKLHRCFKMN